MCSLFTLMFLLRGFDRELSILKPSFANIPFTLIAFKNHHLVFPLYYVRSVRGKFPCSLSSRHNCCDYRDSSF
jgi:hypothetical protein